MRGRYFGIRIRIGCGRYQRFGVGMLGLGVQLLGLPHLHDLPGIHHGHAIRFVFHHGQIVRHEEIGQPQLILEFLHQVQDLGLHRDIECRYGLVGDHDPGRKRQGPGDGDPLALTTAESMRIPVHGTGIQTHHAQQLRHPLLQLGPPLHHAVDQQWFADDLQQVHARIQRR